MGTNPPALEQSSRQSESISQIHMLYIGKDDHCILSLGRILSDAESQLHKANNSSQAIKTIAQNPIDLIICDLAQSLPSCMDLVQWLLRNPETKKIPLLFCVPKNRRPKDKLLCKFGAEAFLEKPLSKADLQDRLTKLSGNTIDANAADIGTLDLDNPKYVKVSIPTLNPTAQKILELFSDPEADIKEFTAVVLSDPGLSTAVLKQVNSALYSFRRKISSLKEACSLLGLRELRNVALSATLKQQCFDGPQDLIRKCWGYSITTGQVAARCMRIMDRQFEQDVLLSGVLHSIGMLALINSSEINYSQIIQQADESILDWSHVEQKELGYSNEELATDIAKAWKLAPAISEHVAIKYCPDERTSPAKWALSIASLAVQRNPGDFTPCSDVDKLWNNLISSQPTYWAQIESEWNTLFEEASLQARILCK